MTNAIFFSIAIVSKLNVKMPLGIPNMKNNMEAIV